MSQKAYGMNPNEVKNDGQKLQTNAEIFLDELKKLVNYNSQLEQIWKGSGAESYFAKWEEKKQSITKLQNWLKKFADATVKSANKAIEIDGNVSGNIR